MNRRAYFVLFHRWDGRELVTLGAGIFSESGKTLEGCQRDEVRTDLMDAYGKDYETAKANLIDELNQRYPWIVEWYERKIAESLAARKADQEIALELETVSLSLSAKLTKLGIIKIAVNLKDSDTVSKMFELLRKRCPWVKYHAEGFFKEEYEEPEAWLFALPNAMGGEHWRVRGRSFGAAVGKALLEVLGDEGAS
jgi:hypothetical protein